VSWYCQSRPASSPRRTGTGKVARREDRGPRKGGLTMDVNPEFLEAQVHPVPGGYDDLMDRDGRWQFADKPDNLCQVVSLQHSFHVFLGRTCSARLENLGRYLARRNHARADAVAALFHTPRQSQVRSLLPRPSFAGLAKWEGNGPWTRHEAVRSRQPVRACSSSEERRIPNTRQRGFNSFLARHRQNGRSQLIGSHVRRSACSLC
jgi:hypothetical protein